MWPGGSVRQLYSCSVPSPHRLLKNSSSVSGFCTLFEGKSARKKQVARFVSDCRNEQPANEAFTSGSGVLSAGRGEKECGKKPPPPPSSSTFKRGCCYGAAENAAAATAAAATVLVRYFVILAATAAVCLAASKNCYNACRCSSNSSG